MGVNKPTPSTRQLDSIPARQPRERWVASEPLSRAQILNGSKTDYEADLHPPQHKGLGSHVHSLASGPGLSIPPGPGSHMGRRAGFQRKLRHPAK